MLLGHTNWRRQLASVRRHEVRLRAMPTAFLLIIGIGTGLLLLPSMHQPGHSPSLIDALFVATSAACVTGLSTVNLPDCFSPSGQAVVLTLIQIGGLGIFVGATLLMLVGGRLSLAGEQTVTANVGRLRNARPIDIFAYALVFVVFFEVLGTLLLGLQIQFREPERPFASTIWDALFHSVSAFCNAGFSTYPRGLAEWRHDSLLLLTIDGLVVGGGIGLLTLVNLRYWYFWRRNPRQRGRLTLQTRIALVVSALLIVVGTLGTLGLEWNRAFAGMDFPTRVSWSLFHSVNCRTAGFNTFDVGALQPSTLLLSIGLMIIGGSPGSMAGGLKTVTFAVLVLTTWSALRRRDEVQVGDRRLPRTAVGVAILIAMLTVAILFVSVLLLLVLEAGQPAAATHNHWLGLVFEAVSAFATVGLSSGVTPLLTPAGKLVIIGLMFLGRVLPLVLAFHLTRPPIPWRVRHPIEDITLG